MENRGTRLERENVVNRRNFFRRLTGEVAVFFDELRGKPQLRLADLWELPKETLAQIKPMLLTNLEISVSEKQIHARRHGEDNVAPLVNGELANIFIIDRIDGQKTIGQIGCELAAVMALDEEQAFVHVRDLFLKLVRLGVCMPNNPVEIPLRA